MDFRQRFLTALAHEEPDRVPLMGMILDTATTNQVLEKRPKDLIALLRKPLLRPILKGLMNNSWFWNRMYYGSASDILESAARLGFDANWTIYFRMRLEPDPNNELGLVFHDVWGRVWELAPDGKGGMTTNYSRGLCATEEQWEAWVASRQPLFDRIIADAAVFHRRLVTDYGDRILSIGYAAPGIFENSWQPMGFVEFTKLVYQKPDFVKRVVAFHTDFYLRYLEAILGSGVDVVLGGDDLGQKTGPLMRPELIEKFYGDAYRRVTDLVHRHGKKLLWHSCGNIYPFLDRFVDWGIDGLVTLEPTAGMDLAKVREHVGHKLVLVGNLDVSRLLVHGTREEIEEAVKNAIRGAAQGGGYVLSAAHSHPHIDATRLRWMVEAAQQWGRYPIRI
jgi:hypothetical protein